HDNRTGGAVIGGGGGGIAGAAIGSSSTNCDNLSPPPPRADYRGDERGPGGDYARDNRDYRDGDDQGPGDGRDYPQAGPPDPGEGCDWADSTVYMPDGTTQKHLVHVCRDARGRYEVVN
ncbi:MAG TPA: hypothetical protein VF459_01450, partial [Caulobacteraceae bacterium]